MRTHNTLRQPSPCDELAELLPGFTVGALSAHEVARVKRLLDICPEQHMDLAQYTTIMATFYERITPVEPPKALHDSIMARIREKKAAERDTVETERIDQELIVTTQTDLHLED